MSDDDADDLAALTGVDVRAVVVTWADDEPFPVVDWSGCSSSFEAEGLITYALRFFSAMNAPTFPDDDDEDDDDE